MTVIATLPIAANASLRAALWEALRWHETRDLPGEIYGLSWAGDGASGGSFGAMQNDCATNQRARAVLAHVLSGAGVDVVTAARIMHLASTHEGRNPLNAQDEALANTALRSDAGRVLVDQLDQHVFAGLLPQLNRCVAAAAQNGGAAIDAAALMGMAIWINAAGEPTVLLKWLEGGAVTEHRGEPRRLGLGQVIGEDDLLDYLAKTLEMSRNPKLLKNLTDAITVGMAQLSAS